ncbi:hypothetical protein BGZ99_009283 [Dissophora globulifera]|uniref:Uncharacterized protein n=1 Tax=Dissophora globulifera TaxID=979702 RepID=A0A9P6UNQ7_9FUNG|nr:hypothetical protein BGZ99_009283 [Dissophora globulifera]
MAVRSHTRDRIELVQDTDSSSSSSSSETANEGDGVTASLLLKIHAGEGAKMVFGLHVPIVDAVSTAPPTATSTDDPPTSPKSNAGEVEVVDNNNTALPDPSGQSTLYFAEADSETAIQHICLDFDSQLKNHSIVAVDAHPLDEVPQVDGQRSPHQTHSWTWIFPSRDHVEDDLVGRKGVFAFLRRDSSSGNVEVVSQFSLWVTDQASRSRIPAQSTSASVNRHWRRASTPERFGTSSNRLAHHQTKVPLIPSTYASLPSLPDAASGSGLGVLADGSGHSASGSHSMITSLAQDTEDGPLFRATVSECENHIRDLKTSTKRIIKAAQTVLDARRSLVAADEIFVKELEGFRPAEPLLNNYLRPMSQSLAETSDMLSHQMRNLLIEPLTRFYTNDIKAAEMHRKAFEDESKEYYQFLSRYMAMKQESNRKKSEADAKYERKRRQFETKRFEYWCFLLDMRVGGSKSDEVLHHLTNYAEKHCRNMMDVAHLAEELKPSLDVIAADLLESHKRAAVVRRERQERRKELLEFQDDPTISISHPTVMTRGGSSSGAASSSLVKNADASQEWNFVNVVAASETSDDFHDGSDQQATPGWSPTPSSTIGSTQLNNNSMPKFSGIRDLEHQDIDANSALGRRKEGFLFATSRPSLHNNSTTLEKPSINWRKYWCVVSEGCLHEYSHWKKGATMPHNEPINLKISTVRPCRNQDRRFCFEVITPKYRRVYQATSAEDMNSWVSVISNAIQSLLDGSSEGQNLDVLSPLKDSKADGLDGNLSGTGRSSMEQTLHGSSQERHVGAGTGADGSNDLASAYDSTESEHYGTRLLKIMRESNPANNYCAECNAKNPDWCAINLGILICIECSGIHRSLGTHISKVRSFTLDTTSYTRDLFDFIRSVGNEVSNRVWESNLIQPSSEGENTSSSNKIVFRRPVMNDAREYKVVFIQKKYAERAFVDRQRYSDGTGTMEEQAIAATKALLQAAVVNNIPDVIAAFAAGADLNAIQEAELDDAGQVTIDEDGTTEDPLQSNNESHTMDPEEPSRLSTSTMASSIVNAPEACVVLNQDAQPSSLAQQESHDALPPSTEASVVSHQDTQQDPPAQQESHGTLPPSADAGVVSSQDAQRDPPVQQEFRDTLSPLTTKHHSSTFTVMQTTPLLVALRHGVPFSLDDQYEVYPMAEFMLQNGAASNLSVEVRLIEDDTEASGQRMTSSDAGAGPTGSSQGANNQNMHLLTADPLTMPGSENGWDLSQVDPEDIRFFQQRSNRRSLGEVVHMRGEGGGTAMEYLRAKSAARGEPMPGSVQPSMPNHTDAALSTSPPSTTNSPRPHPQNAGAAGSASAPTSALSSPSGPGTYSTTVFRQQPTSIHHDISTFFHRHRESDSGLGGKLTDAEKKAGAYKLLNAASVPTSPALPSSSSSSVFDTSASGHSTLHQSNSRAHKVKATLSKRLKLSAAYIKNNMKKEDKDVAVPAITQAMASPPHQPAALQPSAASPPPAASTPAPQSSKQGDAASFSSNISSEAPALKSPTAATGSGGGPSRPEAPLSGSYVILHKKESLPPSTNSPS